MDEDTLIVSPKELVRYACNRKGLTLEEIILPPVAVLTMPSLITTFAEQFCIEEVEKSVINNHYRISGIQASLLESRTGGPAMALDLEVMITLGSSLFIHVGFAGGLHNDMNPGDIIITQGALTKTGIPPIYGFRDSFIPSDPQLTNVLIDTARRKIIPVRSGMHWCTDAPYRETRKKIAKYIKKGALCVEMEGSALFAVSKFHNVRAAAVYVVTDIIKEDGWHQSWYGEKMLKGCRKAVNLVGSFMQDYQTGNTPIT